MLLPACAFASLFLILVAGSPVVQLGETTLNGAALTDLGQEFFGGIPFAEPPIGNLRFAPPVVKLTPGVPTLNATEFGISCVQSVDTNLAPAITEVLGFGASPIPFDNTTMSEDCLTLNIFRPAGLNESSSIPVMVWVYGGGFLDGSANMYNGSGIVAQSISRGTPIIYVNLNYRLGPLGFPQGIEAEARGALNLGNKDVLAALTWVQSNIGTFGGDKDKVTIFGESAGSIINTELLLNSSFDLARAAIFESGSAASHALLKSSDREQDWQSFVAAVPACASVVNSSDTFDCMRSATTEEIFNATTTVLAHINEEFAFSPVIDGPGGIIPELPSELFAKGQFSRIPFIAGTNLDEGPLFVPTTINCTELITEWIVSNSTPNSVSPAELNDTVNGILSLYPDSAALGSPFGTGNETFNLSSQFKRASAIIGDIMFTAPRRQWTQVASNQSVKVFAYLFTDSQADVDPSFLGVPHGSEIAYVFGAPQNGPASVVLSHNMIDYWVSFATSLDPNDGLGNASRPTWSQFTPESQSVINLNSTNLEMIPDDFREEQLAFIIAHSEALLH